MHFTTLFLTAALAVASPTLDARAAKKPNNGPAIFADIQAVNASLYALNATVNTFRPDQVAGAITALKIQQETKNISSTLQKAINDTVGSRKLNLDDSANIGIAVINLVDPINSTLNNIIRHKKSFATAVLFIGDTSVTVEQLLQQQQNLTQTLGNDLGPKLASPFNSLAPQYTTELVDLFNPAIKTFAKCTGTVCLPPI